jgi:hypothetical protein
MKESVVEIVAAFVADEEASVAVEPGEGALHDPPVPAEFGLGVDARASDARGDVAPPERSASGAAGVGLVGVQLGGASARATAGPLGRRDRVDGVEEDGPLVDIGGRLEADERDALPLGHQMVLGPGLAPIRGVRADRLRRGPPFFSPFAGTVELSMLARLQSSRSAAPRRSSSTRCRPPQTPAACQSRSRRQQVIPLPHPISCGKYSHWIPVFNTNTIPVRQARSGIGGRPGFFFGRGFGNNGATTSHNASLTSGLAMQNTLHGRGHFC